MTGVQTCCSSDLGHQESRSAEELLATVTTRRSPPSPFALPSWAVRRLRGQKQPITTDRDRMGFVVELAATNVEKGTGGPFGAAVFERHTGRLVAIGINLVESTKCSLAHAEMIALANAQQAVSDFNLSSPGLPVHELVTSCEPSAMCYGAIPWSGVRRVLCGARASDA